MESINKTPYTPGPWSVITEGEEDEFITRTVVNSNKQRNLSEVAIVTTGSFSDDIEAANAKLISAAPELLESLEQFITLSENNSITYKELEEARKLIFRIKNG